MSALHLAPAGIARAAAPQPSPAVKKKPFDHAKLARAAVERHIRPSYRALAQAMRSLVTVTDAYCADPTPTGFRALRRAFADAVRARAQIEHIGFGAMNENNRADRFAYWPDRRGLGRRQVRRALARKKPGIDDPRRLAGMSVALQGLTAMEVVLHAKVARDNTTGRLTNTACAYAKAIARNLSTMAANVRDAWEDKSGIAAQLLAPGPDQPVWRTAEEATLELMQTYVMGMAAARDFKIEGPLGGEAGARGVTAEYRASKLGRVALRSALEGLQAFYVSGGFRAALGRHAPARQRQTDQGFAAAFRELDQVSQPIALAVEDDDDIERLINISLAISAARSGVSKGITEAADLFIGFNAADGD
ncbi:MAG: imelysin family protein [Pseudomonadota bacterium]